MNLSPSKWLVIGEWLLNRRWWWIGVASLSVVFFEFLEYRPHELGVTISFFFEVIFYGLVLPVSTGLALTALAGSRAELIWTIYYQDLIPNLGLQLHSVHSHDELAEVFLQFVRVVIPVIGVTVYKYEQGGRDHETVLNWSMDNSLPVHDAKFACETNVCPFVAIGDNGTGVSTPQLCRDPDVVKSSRNSQFFCLPFVFSNSLVAGARLCFPFDRRPSPEQVRLLKEIAPMIASTFQRVQLEQLMERQGDKITAEQQRIARDVHDSLGHSLAYLRLRLDQISMGFNEAENKSLQQEVVALRDTAKDAYDQMRQVLITLSPDTNSKISNTLINYADKISHRSDFLVQVHQHGKPRILPPLVQRNIFYIFQEALTNIEKHAHARRVDINLDWQAKCLSIDMVDDGVGFDSSPQIPYGHFGLKNMSERALESNAQLSISSQPGKGTRVTLNLPYEEAS